MRSAKGPWATPGISIAIETPKDWKFIFTFVKRLTSTRSELANEFNDAGVALGLCNLALWSMLACYLLFINNEAVKPAQPECAK